MRLPIAAVLLAAVVCPHAAGAQTAARPSYDDIVNMYRGGAFADAVTALQGITVDEEAEDVDLFLLSVRRSVGIELVKASAMLHTEAAMLARTMSPFSRRTLFEMTSAVRLMTLVEEMDQHSRFVRTWRLLMTSFLQGQHDLPRAMDYARGTWRARNTTVKTGPLGIPVLSQSKLPGGLVGDDDAELRLAVGTIHEEACQDEAEGIPTFARGDLEVAAREMRQALTLQPDLVEARIRLARVLTLDGKEDAATRAFADIDDGSLEPGFQYLARLFRGDLAERRGDRAAAQRAYTAAIDAMPAAQSAQIALAHLEHADGRRPESGARVREFTAARDAAGGADPWLWYMRGMGWRAPTYLAALRQMIHPETDR